MTVFLPRENLFFLEEWLGYHLAIGFEHFHLYDNSGSRWIDCGQSLEVTSRNKRGEPVYRLLADRSEADVRRELDAILAPFVRHGLVTLVPWQPRDESGQITYGQAAAFMDYVRRHARETDWVAFTDVDEFIVPTRDDTVPELLTEVERAGVSYLVLPQKCFASRFDEGGNPVDRVLEISRCADWVTADFGRKALIRADTLRVPFRKAKYSIHSPAVTERRTRRLLDPELIRFNHYKFNGWELDWVAKNLGRRLDLDRIDESLRRYRPRVDAVLERLTG